MNINKNIHTQCVSYAHILETNFVGVHGSMEIFSKAGPRRHHPSSFRSAARCQASSRQHPPGPPDDSQESFLRDEWEDMRVDKNSHIHLKHHQASVCGVNHRGESRGFSRVEQGPWSSHTHAQRMGQMQGKGSKGTPCPRQSAAV